MDEPARRRHAPGPDRRPRAEPPLLPLRHRRPGPTSTAEARVARILFADATHPTPGFYVESRGYTNPFAGQREITGACTDFPAGTQFEATTVVGPASLVPVGASLLGKKACALTELGGSFSTSSYTDGALLKAPPAADGPWTVNVSAGKSATIVCAK